jgi:mevalonate pyrophosphate decarboxylase
MNNQQELYAHDLSLKNLIREAEDFCYKHNVEYDERKIMITTDYGSSVVILYKEENEKENQKI